MPAKIMFVDRSAGFAQQMVRANLGIERLAWNQPLDDLVLLPQGMSQLDLVPVMRAKLQSVPVLVPTWGWPDQNDPDHPEQFDPQKASRLNPALPPDWRWRVKPLLDPRPDAQRPASIRLLPIDEGAIDRNLADPPTVLEAYQAIAARHQHALNRLRNARQILFRANVGRVRFTRVRRRQARRHPRGVHRLQRSRPARRARPQAGGVPGPGRAARAGGRRAAEPAATEGARYPQGERVMADQPDILQLLAGEAV